MARREDYDIILRATDQTQAAFSSAQRGAMQVEGAIGTLKAGFAALSAVAAATEIQSRIREAVSSLADLGSKAKTVNVTTDALQALRFEVSQSGADVHDADAALQKFADSASRAGTGSNYLAKVFAANGISLKDQNGNLRSASDLLVVYARLVANAGSQQDKVRLSVEAFGKQAGPNMVDTLERIAQVGLQGVIERAKELGVVVDKELIEKADEIDKKWKLSSDRISTYLKGTIIQALEAVEQFPQEGTPLAHFLAMIKGNEKWTISLDVEVTPGSALDNILNWIVGPKTRSQISSALSASSFNDRFQSFQAPSPGSGLVGGNAKQWRDAADSIAKMDDEFARLFSTATTKLPGENNALDKAIQSIGKHVAAMEADARSVDATAGAHEALRVKMQLLEAAQNAGIAVSGQYAKKIDDIAARAKGAADALAAAKLKSDVLFERAQLGRTEGEASIAARLRSAQIDPTSAQGEYLANQLRINQALTETRDIAKDALSGFISDLRAGKTAGEAFLGVLNKIADKFVDKGIDSIISSFFGGPSTSLFSSIFGGFRADGGDVQAGRAYVVGERQPEIFVPGTSGRILPKAESSNGLSISMPISINAPGADPAQLARLILKVDSLEKSIPKQIVAVQRQQSVRGVRPS